MATALQADSHHRRGEAAPLHAGDRLPRDEPGRRCGATPEVCTSAPASTGARAAPHADFVTRLGAVRAARPGVQEEAVCRVEGCAIDWFGRRRGVDRTLPQREGGALASGVSPGMSLDPAAPTAGGMRQALSVRAAGPAPTEHTRLEECRRADA